MNPQQVKPWREVEAWLHSKGFVPTGERIDGGRVWRSKSKRHMIVPDHIDDYYPDFMWQDLVRRANEIVP